MQPERQPVPAALQVAGVQLGGGTTSLGYVEGNLPREYRLPWGDSVRTKRNGLHRPSEVAPGSNSSQSFFNAVFQGAAFDSAGRITREIRSVEGTGMGMDFAGNGYWYDRLGRLVADSFLVNNAPPAACEGGAIVDEYGNSCVTGYGWAASFGTTFSFDAVGNRTDRGGSYTTVGNRVTAFDGCSYSSDADGDVTARTCGGVTTSFYWSAESRLDSLTVGGVRIGYRYDASGRLLRRDSAGVVQRHFLWDGDNLLAELDAGGTARVAEYSYLGTDRLHALIVGGDTTVYYAHQDARGSTRALTADTVAYQRYWYTAWGLPADAWGQPSSVGGPFWRGGPGAVEGGAEFRE